MRNNGLKEIKIGNKVDRRTINSLRWWYYFDGWKQRRLEESHVEKHKGCFAWKTWTGGFKSIQLDRKEIVTIFIFLNSKILDELESSCTLKILIVKLKPSILDI